MENFNFNEDYWAAVEALGEEQGARLAYVLLRYAYTGEAPEGEGAAIECAFALAKGRIDAAVRGAEGGKAKAKGKRGAAKPQVAPATEKNADFDGTPYVGSSEKTGAPLATEREGEGVNNQPKDARGRAAMAEEPDRGEVTAWFQANGGAMPAAELAEEAGRFCDHFAAQGWLTAQGAPIVDWRPKARSWLSRSKGYRQRGTPRQVAEVVDLAGYGRVDGVVGDV